MNIDNYFFPDGNVFVDSFSLGQQKINSYDVLDGKQQNHPAGYGLDTYSITLNFNNFVTGADDPLATLNFLKLLSKKNTGFYVKFLDLIEGYFLFNSAVTSSSSFSLLPQIGGKKMQFSPFQISFSIIETEVVSELQLTNNPVPIQTVKSDTQINQENIMAVRQENAKIADYRRNLNNGTSTIEGLQDKISTSVKNVQSHLRDYMAFVERIKYAYMQTMVVKNSISEVQSNADAILSALSTGDKSKLGAALTVFSQSNNAMESVLNVTTQKYAMFSFI